MTTPRWTGFVVSAAGVAAAILTWLALPPRTAVLETAAWKPLAASTTVRGVYHVHTRRSDGTGSVEDVAAAAGRVGLDFLVLTDHGDATRTPDPPRYVGGVLVIDAVEISTRGGHFAALGLPGPAPYRLGGAPADVVEDVARMGGFGIVTHPDSPKKSLAWKDWSLPVPAFEWLNADTEWRDEPRRVLARTLVTYPFRAPESIAALFRRPGRTLERWDRLTAEGRYLVALAGADAHARLGIRDDDDGEPSGWAVPLPSYESVFRAFSTYVEIDRSFQGRALEDAARLLAALRAGRTYTAVTALAAPPRFEFFARAPQGLFPMGASLPRGQAATLVVRGIAPPGTRWRLLRNGVQVAASSGLELVHDARPDLQPGEAGAAYRVEAVSDGDPGAVPWVVSNPIFVERDGLPAAAGNGRPPAPEGESRGIDLRGCRSEKDGLSSADVEAEDAGDHLIWHWRLAGETAPAWVALACAIDGLPPQPSAIAFDARSDEPMRLSVQLRAAAPGGAEQRWSTSVYVDAQPRSYVVPIGALTPVAAGRPAPGGDIRTLLLVVDWIHGRPGMQRAVQVERAAFVPAIGDQVRTVRSR